MTVPPAGRRAHAAAKPTRRHTPTDPSRNAPVLACVLVVGLVGAAAGSATGLGPAAPAGITPTPTVTQPPAPTEVAPTVTVDDREPRQVGEPAVMATGDGTGQMFTVTVTGVTVGFECTAEGAEPPVNGQYVAVDVEVVAGPGFPAEMSWYPVSRTDFIATGLDGAWPTDPVGNSGTCATPDPGTPEGVSPGGPWEGTVILDGPTEIGAVSYIPGGWEWVIADNR